MRTTPAVKVTEKSGLVTYFPCETKTEVETKVSENKDSEIELGQMNLEGTIFVDSENVHNKISKIPLPKIPSSKKKVAKKKVAKKKVSKNK